MRANHPNKKISEPVAGTVCGGRWTGTVRFIRERLEIPKHRRIRTVYAIWSDLFHPNVPFYDIFSAYQMMYGCKRHTFIVCTKRPERIIPFMRDYDVTAGSFPNVFHMTTAGTQATSSERIPYILELAGRGWPVGLSAEPLLEEIDIARFLKPFYDLPSCMSGDPMTYRPGSLSWVVTGCESGAHRRGSNFSWFMSLKNQCTVSRVPFFLKQYEFEGKITKTFCSDDEFHALPPILMR
jgi:protein gp37